MNTRKRADAVVNLIWEAMSYRFLCVFTFSVNITQINPVLVITASMITKRRAVAIVSDVTPDAGAGQTLELNLDAHIIINSDADVQGDGIKDGIVALEQNDDFAMGAAWGARCHRDHHDVATDGYSCASCPGSDGRDAMCGKCQSPSRQR
jgi:hypothetical protein